jgi:hypothetical protein
MIRAENHLSRFTVRRRQQQAKGLCSWAGCDHRPHKHLSMCKYHHDRYREYRRKLTPERRAVVSHLSRIRNGHPAYVGMPFFQEWVGNAKAGEAWIVENIGKRPIGGCWDLHIVDRNLGFIPGNLQWVPRGKHKREEFINQLLLKIQDLEREISGLRGSSA